MRVPRILAHLSGAVGAILVLLFGVGLTIPPAEEFPDSLLTSFHTFFVGAVVGDDDELPDVVDPDWMETAEPGDVLFFSKGHVPWGVWSHVAVVVRAPADAKWVEPGSIAVLDSSIHYGMYLAPLTDFADWPRVVRRRVSNSAAVRERISDAALEHRHDIFAGVARAGAPYSNCTKAAVEALEAVGVLPALSGWRVPDELYRSEVWLP